MCTLNFLGFTEEQIITVPFLVFIKALAQANRNDSEMRYKMFLEAK